jgi:hypothetical protein
VPTSARRLRGEIYCQLYRSRHHDLEMRILLRTRFDRTEDLRPRARSGLSPKALPFPLHPIPDLPVSTSLQQQLILVPQDNGCLYAIPLHIERGLTLIHFPGDLFVFCRSIHVSSPCTLLFGLYSPRHSSEPQPLNTAILKLYKQTKTCNEGGTILYRKNAPQWSNIQRNSSRTMSW